MALGRVAMPFRRELAPANRKDDPTLRNRCAPYLGSILELTLWLGAQVSYPEGMKA